MKRPIEVKATVREPAVVIFPIFVSLAVGGVLAVWTQMIVLMFATICLGFAIPLAVMARVRRKVSGRAARVTPEGIENLYDGQAVWRLPWSRFGGYRQAKVSNWRGLRRPELVGTEILDRQGVVVGLLNVLPPMWPREYEPQTTEGSRLNAFFDALDERVPEGGPKCERPELREPKPYTTTKARVATQLLLGSVISTPSLWLFSVLLGLAKTGDYMSDWRGALLEPLAMLGIMVGITVGPTLLALGGQGLWWLLLPVKPVRRSRRPRVAGPVEGPTYSEFLVEHGVRKQLELQPGVRYRPVHPEARERQLREIYNGLRLIAVSGCILGLVFPITARGNPEAPLVAGVALIGIALGVISGLAARTLGSDLKSLRDTVLLTDDGLVVIRQAGPPLAFSQAAKRRRLGRFHASMVGQHEVWEENGRRYVLDVGHLVEVDAPEELHPLTPVSETENNFRHVGK